MATLLSLERYLPPHRYDQEVVTRWVRDWLVTAPRGPRGDGARGVERLLSVYASAGVRTRASVVPIEEVFHPADFETQNRRYRDVACRAGADVARRALEASGLSPRDIEMVVSVSCTGFMIPAVDAHVANALSLGPRLARLPITESGCAGGVVGLVRAAGYLAWAVQTVPTTMITGASLTPASVLASGQVCAEASRYVPAGCSCSISPSDYWQQWP